VKRVGEFAEVTRVMAAAMTRGAKFDTYQKGRPALLSGDIESCLNYGH
jgi:hypothetical protein